MCCQKQVVQTQSVIELLRSLPASMGLVAPKDAGKQGVEAPSRENFIQYAVYAELLLKYSAYQHLYVPDSTATK